MAKSNVQLIRRVRTKTPKTSKKSKVKKSNKISAPRGVTQENYRQEALRFKILSNKYGKQAILLCDDWEKTKGNNKKFAQELKRLERLEDQNYRKYYNTMLKYSDKPEWENRRRVYNSR